jgi:hypothetical protein
MAQCLGSSAAAYRLEAALSSHGLASAECSCPVGFAGRCKHIAALLLAWLDAPAAFQEVEALEKALKRRSKGELIALIRRMLEHDPDLEVLLEFPFPTSGGGLPPVDVQAIWKQACHAFRSTTEDGGDPCQIARELDSLLKLAGQARLEEDPAGAVAVFRTLAEAIMEHEQAILSDAAGRLGRVLEGCIEGLGECLKRIQDPPLREAALRRLLDVAAWDAQMGGLGLAEGIPGLFKAHASPEERETIAGWTRAALPRAGEWGRKALGRLLEDLV